MKKETKKIKPEKTVKNPDFLIEVPEQVKGKTKIKPFYKGDSFKDASKTLAGLREGNTPQIYVTDKKKGIKLFYEKRNGSKNYRVSGEKI